MPGPGFGPPPGGPRGFGGPGGPRGPRGGMFHPDMRYHFRPTRPPAGGYVGVTGDTTSEAISGYYLNTKLTFRHAIRRKGIIAGTFLGIRRLTSGSLRYEAFAGKLATYDKQLSQKRITSIQCKKRKMSAAKKFNRYLLKIGYYDIYEYNSAMEDFAKSIGMTYINDVNPSPERGRAR